MYCNNKAFSVATQAHNKPPIKSIKLSQFPRASQSVYKGNIRILIVINLLMFTSLSV